MGKPGRARKIGFAALALSAALIAGCGGKSLSGTYTDSTGMLSLKFESSQVYVRTPGGMIQAPYKVEGDKIIIESPQGNLVITRNKDGSLEGPLGTMTRSAD